MKRVSSKENEGLRWVIAQHIRAAWVIKAVSTKEECPSFNSVLDKMPQSQLWQAEFAIFKYQAYWWEHEPVIYWRGKGVDMQKGEKDANPSEL
ncbi:MAG: hypothetical protein WCG34_08900 [Leptolinea sp.]